MTFKEVSVYFTKKNLQIYYGDYTFINNIIQYTLENNFCMNIKINFMSQMICLINNYL